LLGLFTRASAGRILENKRWSERLAEGAKAVEAVARILRSRFQRAGNSGREDESEASRGFGAVPIPPTPWMFIRAASEPHSGAQHDAWQR
jgi:hypothetical protein